MLDLVAAELEQEEELRAQHARDKKQVSGASSCLHTVVAAGCMWVKGTHMSIMKQAAAVKAAAAQHRCGIAISHWGTNGNSTVCERPMQTQAETSQ